MEAEEAEAQPQPKMLLERVAPQLERLAGPVVRFLSIRWIWPGWPPRTTRGRSSS